MRKIYTLFAVAIASFGVGNAAPVFSSTFNTQEEFDQWTVVDENEDGCTWTFSDSYDPGRRTYYSYSSTNPAQDWFVSPAITLPEAGRYIVKYGINGSYYGEALEIYCAGASDIAALSEGLKNQHDNLFDEPTTSYFLLQAEEGETVYVAFKAVSAADKYQLRLQNISVEKADVLCDLKVNAITSPVSGQGLGEEPVVIEVENAEGMDPVSEFDVTIFVDGNEAFTEHINADLAGGEKLELPLSTKVDLSAGRHTYDITATVKCDGDVSESNNSCTVQVRHDAPAVEPYFMGFENDEDISGHKFFDLNEDESHWHIYTAGWFDNFANTGVKCLAYNYNAANAGDDWCILEGIQCEAGYHVLKFWYSSLDDRHAEKFSVHWGTEQKPEAMTNKIVEFAPFTSAPYVESCNVIYLEEPQVVYIGFYGFSDPDQNWIIIDDISLESVGANESDFVLYDLKYPVNFAPEKWHDVAQFSIQNNGINKDVASIKIVLDGKEVYAQDIEMQPFEKRELKPEVPMSALEEGEHTIEISVSNERDPNLDNNVLSSTFRKLGAPDMGWDFEDGLVPAEFTFRNEGWKGLHPDAIEEWGETGWNIVDIEKHELFGEKILGGSSYLESEDVAADIWMVLPPMTVDSEDACISWMAMPLSMTAESYQFYVSDGDDGWWAYSKKFENACLDDVTVGAYSLAEFAGIDVHLAFRINTTNGDAMAFDNINVYGVSPIKSSLKPATVVKSGMILVGQELKVPAGSTVSICDAMGRIVMTSNDPSVDLSNLRPGVYIARSASAEGNHTLKFSK